MSETELDRGLLHLMLKHIGEGLCVLSNDNRFLYVNPHGHIIFDIPDGYLIGKELHDFLSSEQLKIVMHHNRLRRKGQSSTYHLEITTLKGQTKTLLMTGNPWMSEDGTLKGTFGVFRDITETDGTRRKLTILQKALETMHLGVTITDMAGCIIYSNPADLAMHGYTADEVLGQHSNIFGSQGQGGPGSISMLKEISCWERESVNIRKDGSYFPVHLISDVVLDQEGQAMAVVTCCMDITAQKHAAKALHDKEEYLRGILESQLDLVTRTDLKGRYTYVNDAFCQAFGVSRREIIHHAFTPPTHPEDELKRQELQDFLFTNPFRVYYELRQKTVLGWRWIAWQGYAIHDEHANIVEIQSVGRDVSHQKDMEEELRLYATTDTLTGIFNRRTGILLLENAMQRARRETSPLVVCFVDVDNLKKVNDQLGHQEGDNLIRSVCEILKKALRESDIIFRLGGDEFLLIFPNCNLKKARLIWKRIEQERRVANAPRDGLYPISFSHGLAEYTAEKNLSIDDLVTLADEQMYRTKANHRGG